MASERFDGLEGFDPEEASSRPAAKLQRFEHIELEGAAPAAATKSEASKVLCPRCAQPNEKERAACWACFAPLAAKPAQKPSEDVTVCLDGLTYHSSDPNLPADIKELLERIRRKGFSQELVAEWQDWRASAAKPESGDDPQTLVPVENQGKDPLTGNEAFKGARTSVVRINGKLYSSTDRQVPQDVKEVFGYIERRGVTPELMRYLRVLGKKLSP